MPIATRRYVLPEPDLPIIEWSAVGGGGDKGAGKLKGDIRLIMTDSASRSQSFMFDGEIESHLIQVDHKLTEGPRLFFTENVLFWYYCFLYPHPPAPAPHDRFYF